MVDRNNLRTIRLRLAVPNASSYLQLCMFRTSGEMTREQSRALNVLEESLPEIREKTKTSMPELYNLTLQDAKVFLHERVTTSDLPRDDWVWNQSRARTKVTDYTENIKVSFYKLSARYSRTRTVSQQPQFKLWVFNLAVQPNNKDITFLWCEKGNQGVSTDTTEDSLTVELNIEDYGFLADFISEETAKEFGWR